MLKFSTMKRINATKARNNFFQILNESYKENKTFLVEKSDIPVIYIVPATKDLLEKSKEDRQLAILKKIRKFRKSLSPTSDSVKLLREIRRHGK